MKNQIIKKLAIIIIFLVCLSTINDLSITQEEYNKRIITVLDERNIPIQKTIENYKNGIKINTLQYSYHDTYPILSSKAEYIYNNRSLIEELHLTPKYSFIYKSIQYFNEPINQQIKPTQKNVTDYIKNTTLKTIYLYNSKGFLEDEIISKSLPKGITENQEIEYRYNENGKLNQKIIYTVEDNTNVYKPTYIHYHYNAEGMLSETKSYDSENKPLSIVKFYYDNDKMLYRKDFYRAEIVLSEYDTYFERRYIKEKSILYEYE